MVHCWKAFCIKFINHRTIGKTFVVSCNLILAPFSSFLHFRSFPLKLGISNFDGYKGPVHLNTLGKPFLFLGFIPITYASNKNVQGIQVNGHRNDFRNCDLNPNSQITLFPNFKEMVPINYYWSSPVCDNILRYLLPNPSGRTMPEDYFMFGETQLGGCGCHLQTNRVPDVTGMSIGFR